MEDRSQVTGQRVAQLLKELKAANTLINLRLRGVEDYERLTMITDIRTEGAETILVLDPPRGFEAAVADAARWRLQFTFTGSDKLEYHFSTQGGQVRDNGIWVPAPDVIHKVQRRRYFRVETPPGTLLALSIDGEPRALDLINLSQSGGLCIVSRLKRKEMTIAPVFDVGAQLFNLTIVCPGGQDAQPSRASVKKAVVRRVEMDSAQYRHRYALEFLDLAPVDQRTITTFIYRLQREFLRKR